MRSEESVCRGATLQGLLKRSLLCNRARRDNNKAGETARISQQPLSPHGGETTVELWTWILQWVVSQGTELAWHVPERRDGEGTQRKEGLELVFGHECVSTLSVAKPTRPQRDHVYLLPE